ncbi:hypothetical protein RND71_041829 [Anisodus tanguticus]|uniref:AAA+ ATPase domain-containing protein n=1 Tax=Anisodus tanguticus TaxID=243964 RepID=A0AAE1QYG7_9SOLA|nr:hypothetical protein RND71_041829 [Anisodus tanguticus]
MPLYSTKYKCYRLLSSVRENLRATKKEYAKTEDDLQSLQSVGQIIGEVLRPLDNERSPSITFAVIVKASSGPRYVVGCRSKVDKEKLTSGTRVVLDMTTLTIMRALPLEREEPFSEVHGAEIAAPYAYHDFDKVEAEISSLQQEVSPDSFRVGFIPSENTGVLLYGPPGTGKTLLARAIASNIDANFLKVVSSAIIDKYIGESARLIREMFNYARDHQVRTSNGFIVYVGNLGLMNDTKPCIIFMDEIDAISGRRFSKGTSADREIQRMLMELLNQLDGFDQLGKIEIPLPNEQSRMEILKIHAAGIAKRGEIDYEAAIKLAEGFNGADMRNVCTEAGMFAIRAEHDYAVRKLNEAKKLESSAHYSANFGKE